ncbi:TonB-dependent receptor [Dyadobacter aurulentus]|uniref:TonB-dependent receptor n=1 Tax=Dyadobacter sp. UC 10 TaxID=2605428 RepID=UPI0011F1CFFF|nr:TonB-dependent receptor [Dyadobacter sp. UC 10]KAA0992173.1 TonB-dependent receptor [Dyadobacter sp. UC 10]
MKSISFTKRFYGYVMKLSAIVMVVVGLTSTVAISGTALGQKILDQKVTLRIQNTPLTDALDQLSDRTGVKFLYSAEAIRASRPVTADFQNKTLKTVLDNLLPPARLKYVLEGEYIIVKPDLPAIKSKASAQAETEVTGKVLDEKGAGLPGVNIAIKGTTKGTSTDVEGNFKLVVDGNTSVLVFSFVGYQGQEVTVGDQTAFEIKLVPDNSQLNEVVVIGYGTQKVADLTGSVASINTTTTRSLPVSTIDQKMIGQVAGVQIQQVSGAPGAGSSVKIRGSGSLGAGNEPLYVVDGMPYSSGLNANTNPLLFINPNDIESVTVLKDASSTAIYGSRGANGVIMITTKKAGYDRTDVSFSSMRGVQTVPQRGRPQLMNQREFADFQRDRIAIAVRRLENRAATIEDYPEAYRNLDALQGPGTDWYDLLLQSAPVQDHNLSIQKGSKESLLSFSLGYFNQEGTVKYTGVERFSSRIGFDSKIGKVFKVGASLQPTYINQKRTQTNSNRGDILGVANWANPVTSPYDANGELVPYIVSPQSKYHSAWSFANPLFVLRETVQSERSFQNLGIAFAEWDITPELRFKTSINTIWSTSKFSQYIPSTVGSPNTPPVAGTGSAIKNTGQSFNWLVENTLNYEKEFGDHRINALLGYTTQKFRGTSVSLTAKPFANDLIQTINAAQAINAWGEDVNEWSMISYLGRLNYAFKNRYLLTATFRSDGSSRFGANNRFAFFPSVAAAWRVSEEAFFQENKLINNLKLRASFGKSGNNNIGNYSHLAAISAGAYVFGNNQVTAATVGLSNPFLGWEESNQIDVGADLEMFNSRLSLAVDYYYRKSMNMLLPDVIPAITGFNSQTVNKGNIRNTGIEIALGGTPVAGTFNWDVNLNLAFNRNRVLSLNDNGDRILAGNNDNNATNVTVVGKPIGQFFGYVFDGLYTAEDIANPEIIKTPQVYEGNIRYRDINGDGVITDMLDYTIIGNPQPDFIFGFTNSFSYKGLSLNVIVNGQRGGQVMNGLRQTVDNLQGFFNVSQEWTNRWKSAENPGDGRHYGIPKLTPSLGHRVSSLWVEDASYLRISNVTLGYSLPDQLMKATRFIKGARIYATVQNLAMFTKYGGANPEAQNASVSNTLAPGIDMSAYPLSRTVSGGINLTF